MHNSTKNIKNQSLPEVKNIIAIASGKGGVGKSTLTVNLALALSKTGAKVGILDADIYGPSLPKLLACEAIKPEAIAQSIQPIHKFSLQTMSIGYLINQNQAAIWRGPMATGALQQLLRNTAWQQLDYLLIDCPPGTGDIQLTLAQKIPITAAIIVTTPQDLALADVRRAITMFNKVSIPILGVVENMSYHLCSKCGHESNIFGTNGAAKIAQQSNIELLGKIPLATEICEYSEQGNPIVNAEPNNSISEKYIAIATQINNKLTIIKKNTVFPKIVVEKSS